MATQTNLQRDILVLNMEEQMEEIAGQMFDKGVCELTDQETYYVVLALVKRLMTVSDSNEGEKKIYYISAEFLIGKLLSNNLINLGIYDKVDSILKGKGIHTALDTSGILFTPENRSAVDKLLEVTDLVLLDIKHIDGEEHKKLTAHSNKNVLAFAKYLCETGKPTWVRHVLVPGITDNDEYLSRLAEFIGGLNNVQKVEVLPYHTMGEVKYGNLGLEYALKGVQPPDGVRVQNAKRILGVIK